MLDIEAVNHIGVRVADKDRSVSFYRYLGFKLLADVGFDQGHPVIMKHPCGVVINILGPARDGDGNNILMDVEESYPGYTHIALTVKSLEQAKTFFAEHDIPLTGSFSFDGMSAIFVGDPDRNVIELDAYDDSEIPNS
jgi:catechol 2,3-dioxygenase-like lactoylglutathione lyase family enzyme